VNAVLYSGVQRMGDGPGHPRQGGTRRVKLQKFDFMKML